MTTGVQLTLGEAWHAWAAGVRLDAELLWGVQMLWWGRVGKLLEFLSALAILADIIGPERLRAFGNSLHNTLTREQLRAGLRSIRSWQDQLRRYFNAPSGSDEEQAALTASNAFLVDKLNTFLTLISAVVLWVVLPSWTLWLKVPLILLSLGALALWVCPTIILATWLVLAGFGLVLDGVLLEPVAWVLDKPRLDKWIKIASLVTFVIGFHFDLLVS